MKKHEIETRSLDGTDLQVVEEGGVVKIRGLAVPYNAKSIDLGGFHEVIRPSTFRAALDTDVDVVSAINHDPKLLLGRRSNDTLVLTEDERGISIEATPPNTTGTRDAIEMINGGYLKGQSFRFINKPGTDKFSRQADGSIRREVTEARLVELGPVTFPAYSQTTVGVSAETRSAFEDFQREENRSEETSETSDETGAPVVEDNANRVDLLLKEVALAEVEIAPE